MGTRARTSWAGIGVGREGDMATSGTTRPKPGVMHLQAWTARPSWREVPGPWLPHGHRTAARVPPALRHLAVGGRWSPSFTIQPLNPAFHRRWLARRSRAAYPPASTR